MGAGCCGLFRGKAVAYDEEWVEGYLIEGNGFLCKDRSFICPRLTYIREDLGHFTLGGFIEVYESTIGECAGRVDKNGLKIFEGDVVRCRDALIPPGEPYHEFYGVVDFDDSSFRIVSDDMTHYRWMDYEVEVIGSIHDNQELVGGAGCLGRNQ